MDKKVKNNVLLKQLGTTMIAGSLIFGGVTATGLQAPQAVVHADGEEQNSTVIVENGVTNDKVVKALKKDLAKAGFPVPGEGTGYFGDETEKQVRAFQTYYGLDVNGKLDEKTDAKLEDEIRANLQQYGKGNGDTITFKKQLAEAGFPVSKNPTKAYGTKTAAQVKAFQNFVGLVENGIIDSLTKKELSVYEVEEDDTDLKVGSREPAVKTLKENLAKAGFTVPGSGTNYFGTQTETQVKNFQNAYGLTDSGEADEKTIEKLNDLVNSSLQRGKRHADVVELKKMLAKVGLTVPGTGNNFFGAQTEKQVKAFQKDNGLKQNGIVDKGLRENGTWEKLKAEADQIADDVDLAVGVSHKDVVTLKQSLRKAGFPVSKNETRYFGPKTQEKLDEFAKNYPKLAGNDSIEAVNKLAKDALQRGTNSAKVVDLKNKLKSHGFEAGSGTYFFGPKTEAAVKAFQNKYDLIPNGIVLHDNTNDPTWDALVTIEPVKPEIDGLKVGDTDPRVSTIKANLKKIDEKLAVPGVGNNYYGKGTEGKVKEFQEYYNGLTDDEKVKGIDTLDVTGIADDNTIKALAELAKDAKPSAPQE